jgi:hypothetical protein
MKRRNGLTGITALILFFLCAVKLFSSEYINGRIKLVLNEETGRFSLFYLVDLDSDNYEPLFADQDPRTSFLAVQVNDRTFKLGDTTAFSIRLGGSIDAPEMIFDSPGIKITEKFTFIGIGNSPYANGVALAIAVVNKGERPVQAGIRLLLDTSLGEETGGSGPSFITNLRPLTTEARIVPKTVDEINGMEDQDLVRLEERWASRNARYGFMGSLNSLYVFPPSSIHFANWKRLADSGWELMPSSRNFSNPPHSFNDAAVSYIYNPIEIAPNGFRVIEILLGADNTDGFAEVNYSVVPTVLTRTSRDGSGDMPTREDNIRTDLFILRDLVARIDDYTARGEPVPEETLTSMELLIARIKDRYGIW